MQYNKKLNSDIPQLIDKNLTSEIMNLVCASKGYTRIPQQRDIHNA